MSYENNGNGLILYPEIEQKIFTIRCVQVMIDRDLAQLYGVEPKRLGEQVRRNIERFPDTFRFQLTETEKTELVANCDRLKTLKHSSVLPYAFTEQGVAMLSAVLRSDTAVKGSIQIMQAFVAMRRVLAVNAPLLDRLNTLENCMRQNNTERLTEQLREQFAESARLEAEIKRNLGGLGYEF